MTLKTCSGCNKPLSTKDVKKVAKGDFIGGKSLYVNCRSCNSTIVLFLKIKPAASAA